MNRCVRFSIVISSLVLIATSRVYGQQYNSNLFSAMKWRLVGPHRAGRVTTVAGIPGKPAIYYFGTPGGGLWKTTDGGRMWKPIFDDVHVPSISALAVAASDADVIYVGTGEYLEGNGIYKSIDGGATWINVGLRDVHHISSIIISSRDPNIVLVGSYDIFGAGPQHGLFKTTDGGKTWNRVFFKDDKTAIVDICPAPDDARIVYAATFSSQFDPVSRRPMTSESQVYKSTDEGTTWQPVGGAGLPNNPRGRVGVAVAPNTQGRLVYAIMNQGFWRSDDGGATWQQSTKDPRVVGSGYFSRVYVDPKNADVVYVMQTSTYRSLDGGRTFAAWKGEPSGEDDHVLWIDPNDSQRILEGTDQGAVITLDGGSTWSEWFNQPTGEMYHVITDNAFPYRLYASQQDSGSVAVLSRSDFGMITYRDWFSTGAFESGYIVPDLLNPNLVYSVGWYGTVFRLDRTTGQIATVFAPGAKYRYTWETPLVFSPRDPKTLYVGMQYVLKSGDGAQTWAEISPDLTEKTPSSKPTGVIQTIAPSAVQAEEVWVGTSTGLVQFTRNDGANWNNVTPTEMPANSSITLIEASPTDAESSYVIASARNDSHPYIFRTHDAGKTWQKIVIGLAESGIARVVREDPARKGLIYAGTETGVYVSLDGGDHWQPLQLNLPTVSVRDLNVKGNDLVAATYGRALWILDDLSPLRQSGDEATKDNTRLFKPETAVRVHWDNHPDTPLPPDTPHGDNPPDEAIIYYYLKTPAKKITLEIRDAHDNLVRSFSNIPSPIDSRPKNVPDYWFEPSEVLTTKVGLNRFVWNLQWPHPDTLAYSFRGTPLDYIEYTLPDHAVAGNTPVNQPSGPFAVPGRYNVVLTVDGHTYRQSLMLALDPRLHVSRTDLEAQSDLAKQMDEWMNMSYRAYREVASLRAALDATAKKLPGDSQMLTLAKELGEIQNGTNAAPGFGFVNRDLARFVTMIQSGDMRPAASAVESAAIECSALKNDLARWRQINQEKLPNLNALLKQNKIELLRTVTVQDDPRCPNR